MKPEHSPATPLRPFSVLARLLAGASLAGFGTQMSFAADARSHPVSVCADLANLTNFPLTPTQITVAQFNPRGATSANGTVLPGHCLVRGIVNKRIGADGYQYGDTFEVRLPTPADWNGRFMFQGGGGTEGFLPPATGHAGTLSPALAHGWVVASQDGGHENSQLPYPNAFYLAQQAVIDHAYRSLDVTTQLEGAELARDGRFRGVACEGKLEGSAPGRRGSPRSKA